jgi:hypothetical protein
VARSRRSRAWTTKPVTAVGQGALETLPAGAGNTDFVTLSYTVTVPVTSGPHSLQQVIGPNSGTGSFQVYQSYLTALFVPNGAIVPQSITRE